MVEDDESIADLVATTVRVDGHAVDVVHSGGDAVTSVATHVPDLVILDLEMPGMNGHEAAALLRERSDVRILMLTAVDDPDERVLALTGDVDDYMTKPFHPRELRARVQALMRREMKSAVAGPNVEIDDVCRRIAVNGNGLLLTDIEFGLLRRLLQTAPAPVAKNDLVAAAWGDASGATQHTLDVHVHRLRTKLGGSPYAVASVRGVGFRLIEV